MDIRKVLDYIRQGGKYLAMAMCAVAVVYGIANRQFWAPFYVSLACWVGLVSWGIGFGSLKLMDYLNRRSSKKRRAYRPIR